MLYFQACSLRILWGGTEKLETQSVRRKDAGDHVGVFIMRLTYSLHTIASIINETGVRDWPFKKTLLFIELSPQIGCFCLITLFDGFFLQGTARRHKFKIILQCPFFRIHTHSLENETPQAGQWRFLIVIYGLIGS